MPKHKVPLLNGRRALVVNTTNETNPLRQEPMYTIWRERVFGYVGIEEMSFKTLYGVRESNGRQRRTWLEEIDRLVRRFF